MEARWTCETLVSSTTLYGIITQKTSTLNDVLHSDEPHVEQETLPVFRDANEYFLDKYHLNHQLNWLLRMHMQ